MPGYTSRHDGLLTALKQARHRKDRHLALRSLLDTLPRAALVDLCDAVGLPHQDRPDDALRADLFGASERIQALPDPGVADGG